MFKKSLAALAVLGTAAGFACAANVSVYGVVDEGLAYTHNKATFEFNGNKATVKVHNFGLESGVSSGTRFGLKGTEDLGNGMTVGFKLENGFKADDGSLDNGGRLFGREAVLTVSNEFGTLAMGRTGGVASSCGSYDVVYAIADAFGGFDNNVGGLAMSARYDNMVTYRTPKLAGVQGTFQYSFKGNSGDEGREGSSEVNRYASAAVTAEFGALQTVAAYEFQNYKSFGDDAHIDVKDGHAFHFGGNYDCGFAKTFAMVQVFRHLKAAEVGATAKYGDEDVAEIDALATGGMNGYGLHLGTVVPVAGGDLTAAFYFTDGEFEKVVGEADVDFKTYAFGAKYEYPLSKRTSLYTGAGVWHDKVSYKPAELKVTGYQAYAGLTHAF